VNISAVDQSPVQN